MLRISETSRSGKKVVFRLEGEVIGPWVEEVKKACKPILGNGHHLTLDLADVSLVDRSGIALFKELLNARVSIVNCSSYLADQLGEEGGRRRGD